MEQTQTPMRACHHCERLLDASARVCSCGRPTPQASFKERVDFELREWRSYQSRVRSESA